MRAERELEQATFTAWQFARLSGLKKLKPLKDYVAELKPQKPKRQNSSELIAAMRGIAAKSKLK